MSVYSPAPQYVRATAGDNYWAIARRLGWTAGAGLDAAALAIQQANGLTKLYPGQYVAIPPEAIPPVAPPPPPPTPTVNEVADFKASGTSGFYSQNGLVGPGTDPSLNVYRVKPGSSTVPAATTGTTPHRVVRMGALGGTLVNGVVARNLTVHGYQEQVTHGLTIGYSNAPVVEDVRILGVRGTGTTPPGETFTLELWNCQNPTLRRILLDGRWGGAAVASSLLGFNSVDGGTVDSVECLYAAGFGAALWQSGNYTVNNLVVDNSRRAVNCERPYGNIVFNRPVITNRTTAKSAGPDFVFATSGYTPVRGPQAGVNQTSAKVVVNEPVWNRDRGFPLIVGVPAVGAIYGVDGKPHTQRAEDITFVIDGVRYQGPQAPGANPHVIIGPYWYG